MKNIFKILAREEGVKTDNLKRILSEFGEVEVVLDVEGDIKGYTGMTGRWRDNTTAWDILFKNLEEEYVWIIEDDVAFNKNTINSILNYFKYDKSDLISNWVYPYGQSVCWGWWGLGDGMLPRTTAWRSLNCFCRVSPYLIKKVREFREKHGRYLFHEMLLPSLARVNVDFRRVDFEDYFANKNYNWNKQEVDLSTVENNKVYHPVKSDEKHTEICNYE